MGSPPVGFEDRELVRPPQQKFKLLIILLDNMVPVGLPEFAVPNFLPTHNFPNSKIIFLFYYMLRNIAILTLKSDDQIQDFVMRNKCPESYYFIQVF